MACNFAFLQKTKVKKSESGIAFNRLVNPLKRLACKG